MSLLSPVSKLGRFAKRAFGKLGIGAGGAVGYRATRAVKKRRGNAQEYADMKGTRRARCIAAQIANGHEPDDLTTEERAYFYPK